MVAAKAHAIAENIMKLVRFDGGKTGLMVQLAAACGYDALRPAKCIEEILN